MNLQIPARSFPLARRALTLLELVVVLSVLSLLAATVIPKIADLIDRSRSSTQSYTTADIGRQVEIFYGVNRKYPDGWDTLTGSDGALYAKLNSLLTASLTTVSGSGSVLTTATLSTNQIESLKLAGISHGFLHDSASAPSNSGTERRHFGTGTGHDNTENISTAAVVNEAVGSRGRNMLINDFGLNPNRNEPDTSSTPYPRINSNTYVALGLGPKNTIVQQQLLEAPLLENANSATTYSRAIVVFEVPDGSSTGALPVAAKVVGVIGPDGRTKAMAAADYADANGIQPH